MKKNILVISHDANRTGAPILLLNLIIVLRAAGYRINTLIKNPEGPLASEFKKNSDVSMTFYRPRPKSRWRRMVNSTLKARTHNDIARCLKNVDVIINNTLTNGDLLSFVRTHSSARIITYAHELEVASKTFTTPANLQTTIALSDHFMVPSQAVADFLSAHLLVAKEKISRLNYFIPNSPLPPKTRSNVFSVGACGTADWRKGFDIFLLVAREVFNAHPEVHMQFSWKGINTSSEVYYKALYDIGRMGLSGSIELLESSGSTREFYSGLDLFILTSREDPYPLVVLEAAASSVPTVCFGQAGGAAEFVAADAGIVVPYLSIEEMANAIIGYYNQRDLLILHGKNANQKLMSLHQNESLVLRQFENACNISI